MTGRAGYLKLRSVLHDRTTGLPAFPLLFDELRSLLEGRRQIGVLHLEVADLELVESLYGWQVFDRIVARVARALREELGQGLPAGARLAVNRVAGGGFVIFVPERGDGADPDGAFLAGIARTLARRLDESFDEEDFAGLNPRLRFRAGHALLAEDPFLRFERCVYAAVEQARAAPERRERLRELSWGEQLQKIIQHSAVETVFQPVVELGRRAVLGYEAFVRGPSGTLFEAPRSMFELSNRVGMSTDLDRMCCESALRSFAKLGGGVGRKVFLNVLPHSLDDPGWRRAWFAPLLNSLELEPRDLVLEFSERGADPAAEPFAASFGRLRDDGFGLALDDVGTGRAGLEVLERLRPDYLKLDLSLVRGIEQSLIQQEVLLTLVRVAQRIDAAVIAEGVESEAERAALAEGGARFGQGYLFAAPARPGAGLLGGGGEGAARVEGGPGSRWT